MTANQPANTHFPMLSRVLFLVACILLVIAAVIQGGLVAKGSDALPFVWGALSSIALAWAVA
jgi:hypothetical protein